MEHINFHPKEQITFMRLVKNKSNLNWESIARSLNLTRGMLFFYLRGKSKIPKENYEKLCQIAGIKPEQKSYVIIKNKTQPIKKTVGINKDLAELLGILAGDGHVSPINYQLSVTCHIIQDKEYIETYVTKIFNNLFGVNVKIREQLHNNTIKCVVNSKRLFEFLTRTFKIPIGKKKGKLHIPEQIFNQNKLLSHYLRGLFDTDGSVYVRREKSLVLSIASRDPPFLDEVKKAFIKLGYNPSVSGKNLYLYRQEQIRRFFNKTGSSNPKHKTRYDSFINKQ
ncbi:MAG: LAGLIDADG family homing endonuclease [archaeon]|nr:LAGLIDADG family homing endonuclease [archaeon]